MWLLFAVGSSFFAGITAILAKCGIKNTDSNLATAVRTIVVLLFSWLMVLIVGSQSQISQNEARTLFFMVLSGLDTGASWLCYFRALSKGEVNKVAPIDKSSTVLTIVLAFIFFQEGISLEKGIAVIAIFAGTMLMIQRSVGSGLQKENQDRSYLIYAVLSAVFASLTAILGKVGITGVESNLGTAIRTGVVLVMAWLMVIVTGKLKEVKRIPGKELLFICLSGLATGASWLCYYKALQAGPVSVVVPIDKLSILVTVAFSRIVFKERLTKKAAWGLVLITAGTVALALL